MDHDSHQPPVPLVAQLATDLSEAGVRYCHWKSNAAIHLAEQAETDLDLLVGRDDVSAFHRALEALGFVAADRIHGAPVPGIANFFGYDANADRIVHVHAHYLLVVGHDRTKNYRIPIEDAYLESVTTDGVLPTPSPEFEYVVFVIRMVLKYAIADEILWNAARGRRAAMKPSEQDEFTQLRRDIDRDTVAAIVREHLPFIDLDLFAEAESVVAGDTTFRRSITTARRMHAALAPYARTPEPVATAQRVTRRIAVSARRRTGSARGYRPDTGGIIVAVMGGDGSGKSTAVAAIEDWLRHDFDVVPVHLGKPPWSITTRVVRGGLKAAHVAASVLRRSNEPDNTAAATGDSKALGRRRMAQFACKARDRYLAYRKARRAADRGGIVIADRFPHPALKLMDRPQIAQRTHEASPDRLTERLSAFETHYDKLVALPDVAIVLRLEPEEAARRKTDEDYDYVVERSTEVWDINWADTPVHVVDASQTPERVAAEIKAIIWESLT